MIRKLAADELVWFLARSLAFAGHADPTGAAMRLGPRLRDARRDAERTWVWQPPGASVPKAGLHLLPPTPQADDRTARLAQPGHDGDAEGARAFVQHVLERTPHDAATLPLDAVPGARRDVYASWLTPLGFVTASRERLRFDLAEVPPLGTPLALESWSAEVDAAFRATYREAEGTRTGDGRWSWLKRHGARFRPDLWFLARPSPDREAVGYAFCHGTDGLEGRYVLTAAGVLPPFRESTEMLRRLLLTTLHELAARSPVGSLIAETDAEDPKLARILTSIGFDPVDRSVTLERRPD
ncbi:MAG: hypothetical protein WD336_08300 [Trueperaceae bacterium]